MILVRVDLGVSSVSVTLPSQTEAESINILSDALLKRAPNGLQS